MVGLIGLIAFPCYYLVWVFLFPQPYENLGLRLIGGAMFLPFILVKYWPDKLKKYYAAYWLITFIYALPFFFTFMTLMNNAPAVWGMANMAAIMLLFIIADDWLLVNGMFFIGASLGWCLYASISGSYGIPSEYLTQLPIYIFSISIGSLLFNSKLRVIKHERQYAMETIGSNIAHELRTPLLGIRSGATGLRKFLPRLLQAYRYAEEHMPDLPKIRASHLATMESLLDRIESETSFSNSIIEMLLINAGNTKINKSQFAMHSATECIAKALARYPFKSTHEKDKVSLTTEQDFQFFGSELLYTHVIFNLTRNALYFIHEAEKGNIHISIKQSDDGNYVIFRDTGKGIEASELPYIFDQFHTTMETGRGTGIGLSFCKAVMQSFNGDIRVNSVLGEHTEFIMSFEGQKK